MKKQLATSYKLKDLGEAKLILEMKIDKDPLSGDITLSQKAYCKHIL